MNCVLGIETSCDETGVAVVRSDWRILAGAVASQVAIHGEFGGVVPEIASRQHLQCISQLVTSVLAEAQNNVDAVAATNGPGLMGSLLVGVNFAKALAYAWDVPFVPVHHIEGHLFSAVLETDAPPEFPFLALVVSGGHTSLFQCDAPHRYWLLGATRVTSKPTNIISETRRDRIEFAGGWPMSSVRLDGQRLWLPLLVFGAARRLPTGEAEDRA